MTVAVLILIPIYFSYIFAIGFIMFKKRVRAVRNKEISAGYFKDYQGQVPQELKIIANHFENQFQVPVVFFITCVGVVLSSEPSLWTLILAYAFVLSRLLHSYFHLGRNKLPQRASAYFLGLIFVLLMWLEWLMRVLVG